MIIFVLIIFLERGMYRVLIIAPPLIYILVLLDLRIVTLPPITLSWDTLK